MQVIPKFTMEKAKPELAMRYNRQLLELTGCICFPASFALFHTLMPATAYVVAGFCSALVMMLALMLVSAFLARRSAESVLDASQAVEAAATELRHEVEGFLSRVAA